MSRQTTSGLIAVRAECQGCPWSSEARNAVGNAAKHHDATGHTVNVDVTRAITYGDPSAPPPGQDRLVDVERTNLPTDPMGQHR